MWSPFFLFLSIGVLKPGFIYLNVFQVFIVLYETKYKGREKNL